MSCRRCNLYCRQSPSHPSSTMLPSSIHLMPLFVSRPSPSLLAFVARNLVFIGFLGLNFNLVLARKPDLCTSRSLATLWHTYIRYGMVCYGMVCQVRRQQGDLYASQLVLFFFCPCPATVPTSFSSGSNCNLGWRSTQTLEERIYQCIRHAIYLSYPNFPCDRRHS